MSQPPLSLKKEIILVTLVACGQSVVSAHVNGPSLEETRSSRIHSDLQLERSRPLSSCLSEGLDRCLIWSVSSSSNLLQRDQMPTVPFFAAFLFAVTVGVGPDDKLRCFLALLLPLGNAFEVVFLPTIFLPVNRFAACRALCLGEVVLAPQEGSKFARRQVRRLLGCYSQQLEDV